MAKNNFFRVIDLFDFTSFFSLDFFNFLAHYELQYDRYLGVSPKGKDEPRDQDQPHCLWSSFRASSKFISLLYICNNEPSKGMVPSILLWLSISNGFANAHKGLISFFINCICQHLQITLFKRILSFQRNFKPLENKYQFLFFMWNFFHQNENKNSRPGYYVHN